MKQVKFYLIKSILILMTFLIFFFNFSLAVFAGCDLIVTDISWSPANPVAGDEVTFHATIKNQGDEASPSGVIHGVLFKVDGTSVSWSDNYTSSLAPGASATVTACGGPNGKATWTAINGTNSILAWVDDIRRMDEDNWDNKTLTNQLIIGKTGTAPNPTPSQLKTSPKTKSSPVPTPNLRNRGANLPYVEYEAEDAVATGAVLPADRTFHVIQSEASGREAVILKSTGEYVEFTLTQPANSIVIRYCMPDAPGGDGIVAPISLYINGEHSKDITLTSKYAWVYGVFPWSNDPGQGGPHRFFDETRAMLSATLPAGTKVRLQKDAEDNADYYVIDLIDMEKVGPELTKPDGFLSITDYGASVSNGAMANTRAIRSCVEDAKAKGKGVWIPAGTFNVGVRLKVDNITFRGAGMWYSVLAGEGACFLLNGDNCKFYDFALYGATTYREDSAPETGFDGNAGSGSVIQNIWMEHLKCGIWVNGPTNKLEISGCRIRNTFADGINLCGGTSNSTVSQCVLRNTGDDAVAIWSATWVSNNPSQNNVVRNNTIQCPWLANGLAVYGGKDNKFEYNVVYDTINCGAGLNISSNFDPVPFSGNLTAQYNTLIRTGSFEPNIKYARGAIWIWCANQDINAEVNVINNDVVDSTYQGVFIEGPKKLAGPAIFSNINIYQTGTYGIEVRHNAAGTVTFNGVVVTNADSGGLFNDSDGNFVIKKGSGNKGW